MQITPYLIFNGNCREAFQFYAQVLGGKIIMMQTYGESPAKDDVPAGHYNRVIHVHLQVGDAALLGSDAHSEQFDPPQGTQVSVSVPTVAEAERIFKAFADRGKITMPFEKTFWSPGFGMLADRFGTPWMVNTSAPAT